MAERFGWISSATHEVIDRDHPDWSYWADEDAHHTMMEAEAQGIAQRKPPEDAPKPKPGVPARPAALALSPDAAAEALGVSRDYFDSQIKPDLRVVAKGRRILVPVAELERWLSESAARALGD